MAKFSDLLKGVGQYLTYEGRDLGQNLKNIILASRVKRVRPEDFDNLADYKSASMASQEAWRKLDEELKNPSANKILNELLGVSKQQQQKQTGAQLYGITEEKPTGTAISPEMAKMTMSLASKAPTGAKGLLSVLAAGGAQGGAGAFGMSAPGEEVKDTLTGIPLGVLSAGVSYGVGKGLSALGKSLVKKQNIKTPKTAGKGATLDWGLKGKDIGELGGWDDSKQWATEAYSDAKALGLPTNTRYQKASALSKITDALDNDSNILISQFDQSGVPAAKANDIISLLKNDPSLSYARTKDPDTFEWVLKTVSDGADESGNISMRNLKELIRSIEGASGGFKGATDQSSVAAKQIFNGTRSVLRDTVSSVSPELSNVLTKWSKYIKVTPSVVGQVVKKSGLYAPALGKIQAGTLGTEAADLLSSLTSTKGSAGSISGPTALQKTLGNIFGGAGNIGQSIAPALGGLTGGLVGSDVEEDIQLGADDEGMQLIQQAFQQQNMAEPTMGEDKNIQAVKVMLAGEILNGNISASEAEAVLSLLGMGQDQQQSEDEALLGNAINQMEALYGVGTEDSLSIARNVGIGGLLNMAGRTIGKGFNQDLIDRKTAYDQQKALAAGILNKARLAGTLNEGEYQVMIANMPDEYSTEEQARAWFDNVRKLFLSGGYSGGTDQTSSVLEALGIQ